MKLARTLFWDVNYDTIDWDGKYQWIICRVLDRGGIDDWHQIKGYYGIDKILDAAKTTKYLSKKTVYFLSNIYEIPLEKFRCYKLMRLQPEQWIFCA